MVPTQKIDPQNTTKTKANADTQPKTDALSDTLVDPLSQDADKKEPKLETPGADTKKKDKKASWEKDGFDAQMGKVFTNDKFWQDRFSEFVAGADFSSATLKRFGAYMEKQGASPKLRDQFWAKATVAFEQTMPLAGAPVISFLDGISGAGVDAIKNARTLIMNHFVNSADPLPSTTIEAAREVVAILPSGEQAQWYRALAGKTEYRNQRDNEGLIASQDVREDGYKSIGGGDYMCNMTSAAMAFDTLGVGKDKAVDKLTNVVTDKLTAIKSDKNAMTGEDVEALVRLLEGVTGLNADYKAAFQAQLKVLEDARLARAKGTKTQAQFDKIVAEAQTVLKTDLIKLLNDQGASDDLAPSKIKARLESQQYEDVLDELLNLTNLSGETRYTEGGMNRLANLLDLNAQRVKFTGTPALKDWFLTIVKPRLESGESATMGILLNYYGAAPGHIVRLQSVDSTGVTIDDPFGKVQDGGDGYMNASYKEGTNKDSRNSTKGQGGLGNNNEVTWDFLKDIFPVGRAVQFFGTKKKAS